MWFWFVFSLQLPQHQHLPHLIHEADGLEWLPDLPLLPLRHSGQDGPAEPLHAVAGWAGQKTGAPPVCVCGVRPLQPRLHGHLLLGPGHLLPGGPHAGLARPRLLSRLRHGHTQCPGHSVKLNMLKKKRNIPCQNGEWKSIQIFSSMLNTCPTRSRPMFIKLSSPRPGFPVRGEGWWPLSWCLDMDSAPAFGIWSRLTMSTPPTFCPYQTMEPTARTQSRNISRTQVILQDLLIFSPE